MSEAKVGTETVNAEDLRRAQRVLFEWSRNKSFIETLRLAFGRREAVRVVFTETPGAAHPCWVDVATAPLESFAEAEELLRQLPKPMKRGEIGGWVQIIDKRGSSLIPMLAGVRHVRAEHLN